jgi:hypothetical protein
MRHVIYLSIKRKLHMNIHSLLVERINKEEEKLLPTGVDLLTGNSLKMNSIYIYNFIKNKKINLFYLILLKDKNIF